MTRIKCFYVFLKKSYFAMEYWVIFIYSVCVYMCVCYTDAYVPEFLCGGQN